MDGMTTNVANSSGMPSLNSSLGRTRGGKKQGQQVVHQPDRQLAQRKNATQARSERYQYQASRARLP